MHSSNVSKTGRLPEAHALLTAPAPPVVARDDRDLSGDQPRATVDAAVINAAAAALESGQTHYVDVPGIAPLRAALASYLHDDYGCAYEPANLVVTAGIQEARFLTVQKIGEGFGHVALPAVVHPGVRRALGARPLTRHELPVDAAAGSLPSLAGIRAALDAGQKLFYLESPVRLTGKVFDRDAVAELATLFDAAEATVIWDQGLSPWMAGGAYASLAAQPNMDARVAAIGEAWPGSGLDSWFLGYIAAPEAWVAPMTKQKQVMSICTSTASQYAGLAAAELFAEQHAEQLGRLERSRDAAARAAAGGAVTVVPGDTASVLALRPAPEQRIGVGERLREAGYGFAGGDDFGDPAIVRLAVTFDETTVAACRRLARA